MNAEWLQKYPRAAAMLQGDDDVLDYAPQSCRGLEEEPPRVREPVSAVRRVGWTFLEPHWGLQDMIRHAITPPLPFVEAMDPDSTPSFATCDTLLDARMWQLAGQPCPCGQVRWAQAPPRSEDAEETGPWRLVTPPRRP